MIDLHAKYDNMHKNGMLYTLICIGNHVIACYDFMLSASHCQPKESRAIIKENK